MAAKRSFTSSFKLPTSCSSPINTHSTVVISLPELTIRKNVPIGEGASSRVYLAMFKGKQVAMKQYLMDNVKLPRNQQLLLKEASELQHLDHENVIKCFGVCIDNGSVILELAKKTIDLEGNVYDIHSLRQLLDTTLEQFPDSLKHEALYHIVSGLEYLHSKMIVHGDLKSANVLVSGNEKEDYVFKLCDMGQTHAILTSKLATNMSANRSTKVTKVGTVPFEASEFFLNRPKTVASDIYSFGILMHELLYPELSHPWEYVFPAAGHSQTICLFIQQAVMRGERPILKHKPSAYTALMKLCWVQNSEDRPTALTLKSKIIELEQELEVFRVVVL